VTWFYAMTCKFNLIKEIDGSRETLKIYVRITYIWSVEPKNNPKHLEMVFMDSKVLSMSYNFVFTKYS